MSADLVLDKSSSVGQGNIVTDGVPDAPFRAFPNTWPAGKTFGYKIEFGVLAEVGIGTVVSQAPFTFSRSPADGASPLNLGAGVKQVAHVVTAAEVDKFQNVRQAAFATAINLASTGLTFLPQRTVNSAVAFTVAASPVAGAMVYLRLVADGANIPTFVGFIEWGGSSGYDNRAGIVNVLQFFHDGSEAWYCVSQAAGAVAADTTPPTEVNAVVSNGAPTFVDIVFSEAMDTNHVPPISTIAASGHTLTALAFTSAFQLRATVAAGYANGEAASTLAYTASGADYLRDAAGNALANFSGRPITNNVQAAATGTANLIFTNNVNMSAVPPHYVGTNSAVPYNNYGVATVKSAAGSTSSVQMDIPGNGSDGVCLTLQANSDNNNTGSNNIQFGFVSIAGQMYRFDNQNFQQALSAVGTTEYGKTYRLARVGTQVKLQNSADGVTWADLYTYSSASAVDLYCHAYINNTLNLINPKGTNLV